MKTIKKIINVFFVIQLMSIIIYFPVQEWIWNKLIFKDVCFVTNVFLWGILFEKYIKKYNLSFKIATTINNKKGGPKWTQ